jgi:tetratricopeptide (TPR) repeat protein
MVNSQQLIAKSSLTPEQEQQFKYYWYAAREAIEQEKYPEAYALLEFCHLLNPNDGMTLYQLGVIQNGLKHEEEARNCFEQAHKLLGKESPDNLLEQLKEIYMINSEWKNALAIQDELDTKNEYDAYSAITRYRIYAMWGKNKKAIQEIDRYLDFDPENLRFLLFRLELMEHTGAKVKDLYAMYERVLELDPYNLMVLNNYAYLLATHKGDLKKAEQMSVITIREAPNSPVYLDTYGWILHLQGQDELAKFYLNKALWNADEVTKAEVTKHLEAIK